MCDAACNLKTNLEMSSHVFLGQYIQTTVTAYFSGANNGLTWEINMYMEPRIHRDGDSLVKMEGGEEKML